MFESLSCSTETRRALAALVTTPPASPLVILAGRGDLPTAAGIELARALVRPDAKETDVRLAVPEKDRWSVDEVREQIISPSWLVPMDRTVVIVEAADQMDTVAAEQLLKLVEEPPARALFLFCVTDPDALLITLRGRAGVTVAVDALPPADLARKLGDAGVTDPALLVRLCRDAAAVTSRLLVHPEDEPVVVAALGAALHSAKPVANADSIAAAIEQLARLTGATSDDDAEVSGSKKAADLLVKARSRHLARSLAQRWRDDLRAELPSVEQAGRFAELERNAVALDEFDAALRSYRPLRSALGALCSAAH